MNHTKFHPNIPCRYEEQVVFIFFCYFEYQWPSWMLNKAEFYHSEALQSDHAACEI